jgi:hypothetical protein
VASRVGTTCLKAQTRTQSKKVTSWDSPRLRPTLACRERALHSSRSAAVVASVMAMPQGRPDRCRPLTLPKSSLGRRDGHLLRMSGDPCPECVLWSEVYDEETDPRRVACDLRGER